MFPPEFFVIRTEPLGLCHLVHRVIAEYGTGQSLCLGAIYGTGHHWYWIDHTTALPNTTQYHNPAQAAAALLTARYPTWPPPEPAMVTSWPL